jgi:hypothetical protein
MEDNAESREMIWAIAREHYKGWRSTFSATAKTYNNYHQRMLHKPQELDIVEWHYLLKYFSTTKFKICSTLLLLLTKTFFIQMAMYKSLRFLFKALHCIRKEHTKFYDSRPTNDKTFVRP